MIIDMDQAIVMEVIVTSLTRRGDGKDTTMRVVEQFWGKDGHLLAEDDPCAIVLKDGLLDAYMELLEASRGVPVLLPNKMGKDAVDVRERVKRAITRVEEITNS